MQSIVQKRGSVEFPAHTGERIYMLPFFQENGLPKFASRWQSTVDQMLVGIKTDQPIYLMVDQSFVPYRAPQRRPGIHIDGYWNPNINVHGGHRGRSHVSTMDGGDWDVCDFREAEAIILASNVSASRAFSGDFDGKIGDGGDCRNINISGLVEVTLEANQAYAGNVSMLHESLPVTADCLRTLVRLNVPGWTPQ